MAAVVLSLSLLMRHCTLIVVLLADALCHVRVFYTAEQREFEASLKKRKRDFGETLERYESEVDKYAQRSELSKRDEVAAQVTDLSQKLKEVSLVHNNKPQVHVQHCH